MRRRSQKSAETTLVGIYDADGVRATEVAQRCGVDRVETEWRALVEDDGIDAVASFVSVDRNPDVCLAAAAAGKHLLSIKPMARTLEEAREVVAKVRRAGVTFLPAESWHRRGALSRALKQWLEEGRFGQFLHASFSLWAGLPQRWPGNPDPGWFANPSRTAGGGWVDHAIFQIDLMRFLLPRRGGRSWRARGEPLASGAAGGGLGLSHSDVRRGLYGDARGHLDGTARWVLAERHFGWERGRRAAGWHSAPHAGQGQIPALFRLGGK